MSECPTKPLKKGRQGREGGEQGSAFTEMNLCCLREFTTVTKGGKSGEKADDRKRGQTPVRNSFEALAREESGPPPLVDSDDGSDGRKKKTSAAIRRWSRNARRNDTGSETGEGHRAVEACSEVC